jgi:hypothetical protein
MADITMCEGEGCSVKNICYRANAPVNPHWQSYFANSPGKDKTCMYYSPLDEKEAFNDKLSRINKKLSTKGV